MNTRHACRLSLSVFKAFACAVVLLAGAATPAATPYSVPPSDAPELAKLGSYAVGVRSIAASNPDQPDIPKMVRTFGVATQSDRVLTTEVWYPAVTPTSPVTAVSYSAKLPTSKDASKPIEFSHTGIAERDAAPVTGARFPLVLISHGFGGWATFMSYLAENLASKGYVVASINHADAAFTDASGFALSFGSTIVHRSRDQQFVLDQLLKLAANDADALGRIIDAQAVGVIGYSMGGFGALATAGAGYDPASPTFEKIPAALMAPLTQGNAKFTESSQALRAKIKALVLIAPWGAQPTSRVWTASSLKAIQSPILFVVGDQDDIVEYEQGVKHLFQATTASNRYMLVFQNARHNIGGNPPPAEALGDFSAREYFDEPVWRKDRINAINQHFITAFLDMNLKADNSRSGFMNVPITMANDSKWPTAFGQSTGASFATGTAESALHWRGFQRRWAVGLELHRKQKTE